MAASDSIILNPGASGDKIAIDTISTVGHQRVKIQHGATGSATDVSTASPLPVAQDSNGTQNLIFSRYLDTVGDGSGTKSATGDYSAVQGIFRIAPAAGVIYRVTRMIIHIGDTSGFTAAEYGNLGAALGNGVQVRTHNGAATIIDLTDNVPVTTNAEWGNSCYDVDLKTWGAGDESLLVRWTFSKAGQDIRLDGDATEELQVLLDDDLQGLLDHHFVVQGYQEGTPT